MNNISLNDACKIPSHYQPFSSWLHLLPGGGWAYKDSKAAISPVAHCLKMGPFKSTLSTQLSFPKLNMVHWLLNNINDDSLGFCLCIAVCVSCGLEVVKTFSHYWVRLYLDRQNESLSAVWDADLFFTLKPWFFISPAIKNISGKWVTIPDFQNTIWSTKCSAGDSLFQTQCMLRADKKTWLLA